MTEAVRTFRYRAFNRAGDAVAGDLQASDRTTAAAKLQARGLIPIATTPTDQSRWRSILEVELFRGDRFSSKQLVQFVQQLSTLMNAGILLEQALEILVSRDATAAGKRVATELLHRLRDGSSLGEAISIEKKSFPPVAIAMIRAGEMSGGLAQTLARLADYLRRSAAVRETILSALIYPAILVATAIGSLTIILTVVIPQLEPLFQQGQQSLPLATQIVIGASEALRKGWWAILIGMVACGVGVAQIWRDPALRAQLDQFLLRLPVVGSAIRRSEIARFARTLGVLAGSAVPLPVSIGLAQSVLVNNVMIEALIRARQQLKEGEGLADPLSRTGVIPDLTIQMIRIGEATGRLDEMLLKQADLFDAEVQQTIERSLSVMVPALTIGLGIVVAGIIMSVLVAILSINDLVS